MKNTGQIVDLQNWKRKEEYSFFRTFFNPMISVTVEVDCTVAYRKAKEEGFPVSLYCIHAALMAVNHTEEFRYRQMKEDVVLYDTIDVATPILTDDGSYRSVILQAREDWRDFWDEAQPLVEAAKRGEGRAHSETKHGLDILVISVNPWYRFTNVQQAISANPQESIPIFTFGKMEKREGRWLMPVALSVNHGFVSGFQIGQFLKEFQRMLDR